MFVSFAYFKVSSQGQCLRIMHTLNMSQVEDYTRGHIVGMLETIMTVAAVAREFYRERKTVRRHWERYIL